MTEPDTRSEERKRLDEQIAAEPKLPIPGNAASVGGRPIEEFLVKRSPTPIAVFGVVENGLVRPLDPTVHLPENSKVVIVASGS